MSSRLDYLRNGGAIYARSFAMIRAEADLARFHGTAERVVVRMIHACGMTDLPKDVEASEDFASAGEAALKAGAPILCDVRMVADGVTRARLPAANRVICTLSDPRVPDMAASMATTRSIRSPAKASGISSEITEKEPRSIHDRSRHSTRRRTRHSTRRLAGEPRPPTVQSWMTAVT